MLIFTDGSATTNPGPTGAGTVIRANGLTSLPIKLAKAVTSYISSYIKAVTTSYEGELKKQLRSAQNLSEKIYLARRKIYISL